jgi:hypothetical protein
MPAIGLTFAVVLSGVPSPRQLEWHRFKMRLKLLSIRYRRWRHDLPHDPALDVLYLYIVARRKAEKDCLDPVKLHQKWGHRTVCTSTQTERVCL